jgi:hypothetical protein
MGSADYAGAFQMWIAGSASHFRQKTMGLPWPQPYPQMSKIRHSLQRAFLHQLQTTTASFVPQTSHIRPSMV